jgi:hypothetical protein
MFNGILLKTISSSIQAHLKQVKFNLSTIKNKFMKKVILLSIIACTSLAGCVKTKEKGDVTFWTDNGNVSEIAVTVSGQTETITLAYYTNSSCSRLGCATFRLEEGSYSFTAITVDGLHTLSGRVNVPANGCFLERLY